MNELSEKGELQYGNCKWQLKQILLFKENENFDKTLHMILINYLTRNSTTRFN